MFNFKQRTSTGIFLPTWLSHPGPVFLKRHVRLSKYDPLVDEVELIEVYPSYAHIQHKNGSQSTVSCQDLAPITVWNNEASQEHLDEINIRIIIRNIRIIRFSKNNNDVVLNEDITNLPVVNEAVLCRSTRLRKPLYWLDL